MLLSKLCYSYCIFISLSFLASLLCTCLNGCSNTSSRADVVASESTNIDSKGLKKDIPISFQLHDVPHNPSKQKGTDCAPDSLRMVLNYRGKNVGEQDIPRLLTSRGKGGGTSFYQMQDIAVKFYNLPAFVLNNCDLTSIKVLIINKLPPIIGYRISGKYYHAVVAVGYDDKRRQMLVHDPNIIGVRKIRYSDLGGMSNDGIQRLSCLLVLPNEANYETLIKVLKDYIPEEMLSKLNVSIMLPSQSLDMNPKKE